MTNEPDALAAVVNHLASLLPTGAPQIYRVITNARSVQRGRQHLAIADLELFDGQAASIEVFIWNLGIAHRWTRLDGGNAMFNGRRWLRECEAA